MAETSGMAELRGIQIDTLAKGFADEEMILRKFLTNTPTSAREVRWYKKTTGFLTVSPPQSVLSAPGAMPTVVEQSLTRQTSYVNEYFVSSPILTDEDIKDSDPDILAINIRDLVRKIEKTIDTAIYDAITDATGIETTAAIGTGWDDTTNGNPIKDLLTAKRKIRVNGYNPEGAILYINPIEHENLINYLITVKGSSIPSFSSALMGPGVVMEILGLRVVVSENATTDEALVFVPQRAATWKSFMELTTRAIDEPLIGTTIRVKEAGITLVTDVGAVHVTTDTVT